MKVNKYNALERLFDVDKIEEKEAKEALERLTRLPKEFAKSIFKQTELRGTKRSSILSSDTTQWQSPFKIAKGRDALRKLSLLISRNENLEDIHQRNSSISPPSQLINE